MAMIAEGRGTTDVYVNWQVVICAVLKIIQLSAIIWVVRFLELSICGGIGQLSLDGEVYSKTFAKAYLLHVTYVDKWSTLKALFWFVISVYCLYSNLEIFFEHHVMYILH